ncbi:hypothetical protein C1645_835698 [Glomus cerebriforme]|uniref:Uncharacterized protein n=1 Tax=Glomus cerebriforme TaxID=658196 RepID=A0A397S780_9GLOM|nr:hypothetical protein C1645_835698 [Glomus cerebriforme]
MAGFLTNPNNKELPILFYDQNIKPLLFSNLFPYGKGFYKYDENTRQNIDSLGNYAKSLLLWPDSRWCLSWYWPHYIYLTLENVYTGHPIINKTKTTTVPSYIRTGDSYFHQKEHHINTIVQGFNLPQIFYTVTIAENHWTHLHKILSNTDNKDPLPSNRPFHTYLHYHHQLINSNVIRADIPDFNLEPELYELVKKHQIHTLRNKSVKPPYLLQQEEQLSPYWDDAIDKYFNKPTEDIFDNMIYPIYHRKYTIQKN